MRLAISINFPINPGSLSRIFGNLHVYSNMICMGNTTPAGVAQPATVYFYKHTMPPASLLPLTLLPLTSVNGNWSLDILPLTSINGNWNLDLLPLTSINGNWNLDLLPLTSINGNWSLDLLPLTSINGNWNLELLPLTSVNGKETAPLTTGLQPHSMWLKPVTLVKSANRQLKQTAIEMREPKSPAQEQKASSLATFTC